MNVTDRIHNQILDNTTLQTATTRMIKKQPNYNPFGRRTSFVVRRAEIFDGIIPPRPHTTFNVPYANKT